MLVTFPQVLTALRRYRGEFILVYGTAGGPRPEGVVRHTTDRNPDGSYCCPLAFLARTWGLEPAHNRDFAKFERALYLDPDTIARVVRAADGPRSSDRTLLEEACL